MTYILEHIIAFSIGFIALWLLLLVIYLTIKRSIWRRKRAKEELESSLATPVYEDDLSNDPIIQHIIAVKRSKYDE